MSGSTGLHPPMPRPEHPRPDRFRPDWHNLNGTWEFAFEPADRIPDEREIADLPLPGRIAVPFPPESRLSGVHDEGIHPVCWYRRTFDRPAALSRGRILLHFGAVDHQADVWLNGVHLGTHTGGYDPFSFDVTSHLEDRGNILVVRALDDPGGPKCRGKQSPERYPSGCLYMRVTGIWQTVWLEKVGRRHIRDWRIQADPHTGEVRIHAQVDRGGEDDGDRDEPLHLTAEASYTHIRQAATQAPVVGSAAQCRLQVQDVRPWSPDRPDLYRLELSLADAQGREVDRVHTYFGFRTVEIRGSEVRLNGEPLFFRSALDQGYHPDGLYTPPSDAAQREDVLWAKRYGLNGIRKHQMIPEPRFLYWCDVLGLLVWGEMADWGHARRGEALEGFLEEWGRCVTRDVNHPSLICWVPTNEWTGAQDAQVSADKARIYEFTRKLDPTRPVIDTSGYCHTVTDICDLHVNPVDGPACRRWWKEWRRSIGETGNFPAYPDRPAFSAGHTYRGQPVIFSETGNWRIEECPPQGPWEPYGYGPVRTAEEFVQLYRDFFRALMEEPDCAGFCYVQLYDVEGEVNGYLTYDRRPKVDPEIIRRIHEGR